MEESKKLTTAQRNHLTKLVEAQNTAINHVNEFIHYLRDEHACPECEYELQSILDGFVRKEPGKKKPAEIH